MTVLQNVPTVLYIPYTTFSQCCFWMLMILKVCLKCLLGVYTVYNSSVTHRSSLWQLIFCCCLRVELFYAVLYWNTLSSKESCINMLSIFQLVAFVADYFQDLDSSINLLSSICHSNLREIVPQRPQMYWRRNKELSGTENRSIKWSLHRGLNEFRKGKCREDKEPIPKQRQMGAFLNEELDFSWFSEIKRLYCTLLSKHTVQSIKAQNLWGGKGIYCKY